MDMFVESFGDLLGASPLDNEVEEGECRRRGVHQTFIVTASTLLGWETQRIMDEYHSAYKEPIRLDEDTEIPVNEEHLERIVYWSKEAENDVTLFEEDDFVVIERLVQQHHADEKPLDQMRFQKWIQETDFKGQDQFGHLLLRQD